MKKLVFALMLFTSVFAQAQVSVNVNIGTPPNWGPVGYDNSRYYYLPDIDVYYDVNQSAFIYDNSGRWVREKRLPERYRNYDLYSGYKVVLNDYRGDAPYTYHSKHRAEYPKGYHGKPQKNRGEKPEKHDNGKHKGNDKHHSDHDHDYH
ncbi:hypothetical protein [Flavobacterium daemonense]|uniref:hypothetical protein n=1 Tax=Flavobacterium daemonense TaxID=1393049 RepID=UPI001186F26A|nr:hypothetical protein [Flavobacterium daemonense]KAF2336845.1 hypothetical protein FND99_00095 [Flavobacterium daemonense]